MKIQRKVKVKFFKLAQRLSLNSSHHTHKIGAVISKKNRIISLGFNQLKTSPNSPHPFKTLHAEVDALLGNSYQDLKGCVIYVYRETKDGLPANSKPCPTCEFALKRAGIKKVYYSLPNEQGYGILDLRS
jgi:dCMP deaminase